MEAQCSYKVSFYIKLPDTLCSTPEDQNPEHEWSENLKSRMEGVFFPHISNLNCTTWRHIPDKHSFKEILIFHAIFKFKHTNCSRIHILLIKFVKKDLCQQFVNTLTTCTELLCCTGWYQNQCLFLIWFQINCVSLCSQTGKHIQALSWQQLEFWLLVPFPQQNGGHRPSRNKEFTPFFFISFCCSGSLGMQYYIKSHFDFWVVLNLITHWMWTQITEN